MSELIHCLSCPHHILPSLHSNTETRLTSAAVAVWIPERRALLFLVFAQSVPMSSTCFAAPVRSVAAAAPAPAPAPAGPDGLSGRLHGQLSA